MLKNAPQHVNAQNQPAKRSGKGAVAETPQTEQIAQLESMMESSPQVEQQAHLAAMMHTSPTLGAHRKLGDMMFSSPRQAAQQKFVSGIHNSPQAVAQRKRFSSLFSTAQRQVDRKGGEDAADLAALIDQLTALQMEAIAIGQTDPAAPDVTELSNTLVELGKISSSGDDAAKSEAVQAMHKELTDKNIPTDGNLLKLEKPDNSMQGTQTAQGTQAAQRQVIQRLDYGTAALVLAGVGVALGAIYTYVMNRRAQPVALPPAPLAAAPLAAAPLAAAPLAAAPLAPAPLAPAPLAAAPLAAAPLAAAPLAAAPLAAASANAIVPPSADELRDQRETWEKEYFRNQRAAARGGGGAAAAASSSSPVELTKAEIADATARAKENSARLSGHGRQPHGSYAANSSAATLERDAKRSEEAAIEKEIAKALARKKREAEAAAAKK